MLAVSRDHEDEAEAVSEELVLYHRQGLQVQLHPGVKPRRVARSVKAQLVKVFGQKVSLVTVLVRDSV